MKPSAFRGPALRPAGVALTIVLGLAALGIAGAAAPARRTPPRPPSDGILIVPVKPESVSIESEPAPLLGPGMPNPVDRDLKSPEERAREQFGLGLALERSGQIQAAYFAYHNASRFDPKLPEAHFRQGRLLAATGNLAEAERAFLRELELSPGHREADLELGYALSRLGRHDEAIARLEALRRREPGRDEHWYALGVARIAAGRYEPALEPLRKAIAMPPQRSEEHRDLGVALAALGRVSAARAEYRRALALDPAATAAWLDLANLERRAGRPDSALAAYRRAERSDSSSVAAYEGQIALLASPAEQAEVRRRWAQALPGDHDARMQAVRAFDELGREDVALEIARDGVRRNRRSAEAHTILGIALEANGEYREAMRELRLAAGLHRGDGGRLRVQRLIDGIRSQAPDSLHAAFDADSAAGALPETAGDRGDPPPPPPPGTSR